MHGYSKDMCILCLQDLGRENLQAPVVSEISSELNVVLYSKSVGCVKYLRFVPSHNSSESFPFASQINKFLWQIF